MDWPDARPETYDEDLYWDEESGTWGTASVSGPGNRIEHLVAVSDEGEVYFGEI